MPISINEAVSAGITKLRLEKWSNSADYISISILKENPDGTGENQLGPWYELWSPLNTQVGNKNPVKNLIVGQMGLGNLDDPCWTIYPIEKEK